MKPNIVKEKSFVFSLEVVKLYKQLCKEKNEFVLSKQLLRSGTAIGALIREAEHAESKKDFIHKFAIAQKEVSESIYWLELLYHSEYLCESLFMNLCKKAQSLSKIISSIILTTKQKYL